MKRIKLTTGRYATVDNSDYDWLNQWKWRENSQGYVSRNIRKGKKQGLLFMHKLITRTDRNSIVDHINRNPLDNRRSNLRVVTATENNINMKIGSNNKSGFKGVCWHGLANKWSVEIKYYGNRYYIGLFDDIAEAIGARFTAELEYFGVLTHE